MQEGNSWDQEVRKIAPYDRYGMDSKFDTDTLLRGQKREAALGPRTLTQPSYPAAAGCPKSHSEKLETQSKRSICEEVNKHTIVSERQLHA